MANKKQPKDTLENEVWNILPFDSNYSVSSCGRVYSERFGRFLSWSNDNRGYYCVCINGRNHRVHRLVAATFLNFDLNFKGKEINHIDGNKENNDIANLEIVTHKENIAHAIRNGLWGLNKQEVDKTKYSPISLRLRFLVKDILRTTPTEFIKKTHAHRSILCGYFKTISPKTLEKIVSIYPISEDWILNGVGNIYKQAKL